MVSVQVRLFPAKPRTKREVCLEPLQHPQELLNYNYNLNLEHVDIQNLSNTTCRADSSFRLMKHAIACLCLRGAVRGRSGEGMRTLDSNGDNVG